MKKMKHWFTHQNMSWLKVILFAVIVAVVTAAANEIPFLKNTSFQNIAIGYECWILFAVFVIINCQKWWEAALKTFLFFLISQPLIFLFEAPFDRMGWAVFQYYPRWFFITLLTIPGAIIAYQLKRKDWLSVLVLSIAAGGLGYIAASYFWGTVHSFPHNIISVLFCIAVVLFLAYVCLDKPLHKIIPIVVCVLVFAAIVIIEKPIESKGFDLPDGQWEYSIDDASIVDISIDENGHVTVKGKKDGTTLITFTNADGDIKEYYITYSPGGIMVNEFS